MELPTLKINGPGKISANSIPTWKRMKAKTKLDDYVVLQPSIREVGKLAQTLISDLISTM